MKESNDLDDQYISVLLEKQVKRIIFENDTKDSYFTIRQIFDIDQFVWDIAVYIYKSSGYHIDLLKTKQLISEHQSSAWVLYKEEQEKIRLENLRIQEKQEKFRLENIRVEKERIQLEIKNLESEEQKLSGQYLPFRKILEKINSLQQEEVNILKQEEEYICRQVEKAEQDYDLNKAAQLKFGKLAVLQQEIKDKETRLIEIQEEIQTKIELERIKQAEQERIRQEEIQTKIELERIKQAEQERIRQAEQDKSILDQIKPLMQSIPELENSVFKAKVYLCLTKIIAEIFDTDIDGVTWKTDFKEDLDKAYPEQSISYGPKHLSCIELIMALEELLDIEISDEESEKCLTKVGKLVDYIISRFQENPGELEKRVTKLPRF